MCGKYSMLVTVHPTIRRQLQHVSVSMDACNGPGFGFPNRRCLLSCSSPKPRRPASSIHAKLMAALLLDEAEASPRTHMQRRRELPSSSSLSVATSATMCDATISSLAAEPASECGGELRRRQ